MRHKSKLKLLFKLFDRAKSVLKNFIYILNFHRVVFENFDLKNWLKYGTVRIREQVRSNYCKYSVKMQFGTEPPFNLHYTMLVI